MVGEAVQQRAGGGLRPEDRGLFFEGKVGGDGDGAPLVTLAEDLAEKFPSGGLTGVCINIMDLDITWLSGINSVLNR